MSCLANNTESCSPFMGATGAASDRFASSFAPLLKSLVVMISPRSCAPREPRTCRTTGAETLFFQHFACTAIRIRTESPTTKVQRTSMPPSPEIFVTSTSSKPIFARSSLTSFSKSFGRAARARSRSDCLTSRFFSSISPATSWGNHAAKPNMPRLCCSKRGDSPRSFRRRISVQSDEYIVAAGVSPSVLINPDFSARSVISP